MEQAVFSGLAAGNEVLKELHSQMSIDDIEQLMLDTQEAIDYQQVTNSHTKSLLTEDLLCFLSLQEIETALAGKLSADDEEDVLEQLHQLELEVVNQSTRIPLYNHFLMLAISDCWYSSFCAYRTSSRNSRYEIGLCCNYVSYLFYRRNTSKATCDQENRKGAATCIRLTSITCSLFIHTKIFNKFFLKHAECYRC
jgi:hypothetical protein